MILFTRLFLNNLVSIKNFKLGNIKIDMIKIIRNNSNAILTYTYFNMFLFSIIL